MTTKKWSDLPSLDVVSRKYKPLAWQAAGLSETASGYGDRLRTSSVVVVDLGTADNPCLVERRVYVTQHSNAGTAWVMVDGERRTINGLD